MVTALPLLADPEHYRACDTDLLLDHDARAYWLDLFGSHFNVQLEAAASNGVGKSMRDAARAELLHELERIRQQPDLHGRLDILMLDEIRHRVLEAHDIHDEFRAIKQRENDAALAQLPGWLYRLDRASEKQRLGMIVRGMLAGNLFDMGVAETAAQFGGGHIPFDEALARVPQRPWLIDDLDAASREWGSAVNGIRKVLLFADNAGGDAVLGLLPLAREMLKRGVEVIIAANDYPNLNDVTCDELRGLVERAGRIDGVFASPGLSLVQSGNSSPLIDLSRVSDELAVAATGTDLIVLIGMGRAVESNYSAKFTCRCWRVAMIKDPQVARTVGAKVYDAVFKTSPANPRP